MEPTLAGTELRSPQIWPETHHFKEENSFTALLELPSNQAVELLTDDSLLKRHRISAFNNNNHKNNVLPAFPSNRALIERAAKFSVFAAVDSPEPSDSGKVKSEPNSASDAEKPPLKRKEREKKGKGSSKKSNTASNHRSEEDGEKLPYVHVRARRGQATDSHSLAERARREKINARMKLLQELVPGCNKISGTALVLDEIINHVQSLQRQVEYLSMRLAAVNPRIDFNLDSLISAGLNVPV